jgi:hypothetical protein
MQRETKSTRLLRKRKKMRVCAMETVEVSTSTTETGPRSNRTFLAKNHLENPRSGVRNGNSGTMGFDLTKLGQIEVEPFGETIDGLAGELGLGSSLRDIAVVFFEQVLQKGLLDGFDLFITNLVK